MEQILYILSKIALLICLAALIYLITAPDKKSSDESTIF